jgi:hypothetical protein
MNLSVNFTIDMLPDDIDLYKRILGCANNAELELRLSTIGKAALSEYNRMILGQRVFTRGKDILEHRLLNLIKFHFNGQIPSELQISALFQITATESRGLIRSITSKYQYELTTIINQALTALLRDQAMINAADNNVKMPLNNLFFKDELNKVLSTINSKLPMVEKDPKTNGMYTIQPSSYSQLCQHFQIAESVTPYA